MRKIAALALVLVPLTAAASQPRPENARSAAAPRAGKPACDRFAHVDRARGLVQQSRAPPAQRLDRLPPADLHLTVERTVGGCHVPVIIRQDVGGAR